MPPNVGNAIKKALGKLAGYVPSSNCQANVLNKLPGSLSVPAFQVYLAQDADFFDGPGSSAAFAGSVYPTLAGQSALRSASLPVTASVGSFFNASPGVNAITSVTASRLTIYMRSSAVSLANQGLNARNQGFLFHEALHGFSAGAWDDGVLEKAFGVPPPSVNITNHIASNCQ